jgi:general secretion pathway protein D
MDRSKSIISIIVGLAAVLIIWWVGFHPEVPKSPAEPNETKVAADPNKPGESKKPADANEPARPVVARGPEKPKDPNKPDEDVAKDDQKKPEDPNDPMESLNLKNVAMKDIVKKIADWTGKTIIPDEEAEKIKVTIYAPKELPRSKALSLIYAALRMKGFNAEFTDDVIYIKPISEAKLGEVPTIAADYPLELIENKDQIVQKFFKLKNYSPSQMGQILMPLIGEYGHVSADENTGTLSVIDTVKNLMRIGLIIEQYDVVEAAEIETEIFEIHNGNPEEMVALLEKLLSSSAASATSGRRGPFGPRPSSRSSSSGAATTVTVGTSRTPAVLIPETTYNWIIAKATPEDLKQIGDWIKKLDKAVPTVTIDQPLATFENKNQVVQRFYRLQNYSSSQMAEVVGQLLTDQGHLSADESTRTLMVMDTVKNLMRIEGIIDEFDVPEAEQTVTDTFELFNADPGEVVQLLRTLLSFDGSGGGSSSSRYGRSRYGNYGRSSSYYGRSSRYSSYGRSSYGRSSSGSSAVIGTSQVPIVLIPEPTRNWIIARASAEDMKKIAEWIDKLDRKESIDKEYETVPLGYADVEEVAERLNEAIQQMPGSELQQSILIQPLTQANQIMVFGREDLRAMVKKLIAEIDIPSGMFQTKVFELKYADADKIKENLELLYETEAGYQYGYSYSSRGYSRRSRNVETKETVRVIAYSTMHQVTVIASPENMGKIAEQIAEWDVPLDLDAVKPRILTLRNSDPVQMADLLKTLFSEDTSSSGRNSFIRYIFGDDMEEKQKIVGPLYGQLTFEEVPGTKKIIVISNVAGAYDVIEDLIRELDSEDAAETPTVIELMYADPEDLSERLNALFVEAGQTAPIRYRAEGLTLESEMDDDSSSGSNANNNNSPQLTTYTPPWSGSGARNRIDEEMPISNIIGRVRFVPEPHRKAIMVLAPPEFIGDIKKMISDLDVPGKQVVIEAIILEIEHSKLTSLGVELATNPAAFGSLSENSITALSNLTHFGTHGSISGTISSSTGVGVSGASGTLLGVGTDVYALIDFLIKEINAKIMNQQTIWTKDNEEASLFQGSEVAFLSSESITNQTATQGIDFEKVGMELMVRPSITPESKVDMLVNVHLSSLLTEIVNNQPVRSRMNTTTNMIVEDNQTLLLGGILFQEDSTVERKLPLLGDLPLVGGLFRHTSVTKSNSEMLVFITPHVKGVSNEDIPETEKSVEKLNKTREHLNSTLPSLEEPVK